MAHTQGDPYKIKHNKRLTSPNDNHHHLAIKNKTPAGLIPRHCSGLTRQHHGVEACAPRNTVPSPRCPPDTWHARGVRSLRRRSPWPAAHADGVSGVERETVAEQWLPGLHAGYAYLDSEQRSGAFKGNEVPFASAHQLTVDGRYRFAEAWTYTLDGLYVSSAYTDAANSHAEDAAATVGELPAYWLWNTAIEREFKLADGSLLTTSAGVSNLFDREYYFRSIDTSPWGRQPAPGRTLTLGVNYRF